MANKISESTEVTLDLKTIGIIAMREPYQL